MKTVMVIGKGRSGTTWLAHILNTYPHCVYKHEPFLRSKKTPYRDWRAALERGDNPAKLHAWFQKIVSSCFHEVDQPPFVAKSTRHQDPRVLQALYGLGNIWRPLRRPYEWYGRPHMHVDADILIKDVNFPNELLGRLCEALMPHLIPIIRNPFANIASHSRGIELGCFPPVGEEELARVVEVLSRPENAKFAQFRDPVARRELSPLQLEGLRWRLQVEPLLEFAQSYKRSHVVVYEDLCVAPLAQTEKIFAFLDWKIGENTVRYLRESTAGERKERNGERSYYTTFRDPQESMNKWRDQMTPAQQEEIASMVQASPFIHLWKDLPV